MAQTEQVSEFTAPLREPFRGAVIETSGWNKIYAENGAFVKEEPVTSLSYFDIKCSNKIRDQIFRSAAHDSNLKKSLETPGYLIQIDLNRVIGGEYAESNMFRYYQVFGNSPNNVVYDKKHLYIRIVRNSSSDEEDGEDKCEQVRPMLHSEGPIWPTAIDF